MTKFLQINLNCCKAAQDLMHQSASENDVDFIFVSEYNSLGGNHWYPDSNGKSAIVCNFNSTVDDTGQSEPGFRWITIGEITLYSCYWSPNTTMQEYEQFLARLESSVRGRSTEILIAGDFNAWHTTWSSRSSNRRGEALVDTITSLGMVICNRGNSPTFQRGNQESFIDLTMATPGLAARITDWEVSEATTLSDHNYVQFALQMPTQSTPNHRLHTKRIKLDYRKLEEALCSGELIDVSRLDAEHCASSLASRIVEVCGTEAEPSSRRKSVFWWSPALNSLRKTANHSRRVVQRKKRKVGLAECTAEIDEMKRAKLELTKAIRKAKEQCWKKLCDQVEQDPWGTPYKLVMGKLTRNRPAKELQQEAVLQDVVSGLFPVHPPRETLTWKQESAPRVTPEELSRAVSSLRNNISPGIDGITNEALKLLVRRQPHILLNVYNKCIEEGRFPRPWKRSRLVLIKKGEKPPGEPSSYRPLCLLDCTGKLYEKILDNRLRDILDSSVDNGLSANQYGFRRGRSTLDALTEVCRTVDEAGANFRVGLLTLDIRNAFNTAPWGRILAAMRTKDLPPYLCRIVDDYFSDRTLHFQIPGKAITTTNLSSGVPQGSVLGPTLWNILYDELLNLWLPVGVKYLAFADDVAIIARAKDTWELERLLGMAAERTSQWLRTANLQLALQKSEAVVFSRKRQYNEMTVTIEGTQITAGPNLKYLGVQIDGKLNFTAHSKLAADKASKAVQNLQKIMPNVSAAKQGKRMLLSNVVHSLLLYGAPIWANRMSKKGMADLERVQRRIALRVASAYRTTSMEAVLVVASIAPLELQATRRRTMYHHRTDPDLLNVKQEANDDMTAAWQERWDGSSKGRWTQTLIKEIKPWVTRKHGVTNYWLTQALTGHGCFNAYLHKVGKLDSAECWFCEHPTDDAHHTFFRCDAWATRRFRLEAEIEAPLTPESVIGLMLRDKRSWDAINHFVQEVLVEKSEEGRRRQNAQRNN